MSFSFVCTAYEEMSARRQHGALIKRCLSAAIEHPGIDEVVVVDDCSDDFRELDDLLNAVAAVAPYDKYIETYHNRHRLRCFGNKIEAILRCNGDWCICPDSDNFMDADYIDRAIWEAGQEDTWLCPSFAKPHFDYRGLVGVIDRENIAYTADIPGFDCLINTGNWVIHRPTFTSIFRKYRGVRAIDAIWPFLPVDCGEFSESAGDGNDSRILNYIWLMCGGSLRVVDGLEYDHYVGKEPGNYVACAADPGTERLGKLLDGMFKEIA